MGSIEADKFARYDVVFDRESKKVFKSHAAWQLGLHEEVSLAVQAAHTTMRRRFAPNTDLLQPSLRTYEKLRLGQTQEELPPPMSPHISSSTESVRDEQDQVLELVIGRYRGTRWLMHRRERGHR